MFHTWSIWVIETLVIIWAKLVIVEGKTVSLKHSIVVPTVDGRNPANQLRLVVFIPLFTRFHTSQVVQDFSHQQ